MINSHIAASDLRIRKCGSDPNSSSTTTTTTTTTTLKEEQQASGSNTLHFDTGDNTTQETGMTATNRSMPHRSSLVESSAEDLDMWRNELPQTDKLLPDTEEEQPNLNQREKLAKRRLINIVDTIIRIVIVVVFVKLETTPAFKREIHAEELWLYKNPRRPDIVRGGDLLILVIAVPLILTLIFLALTKDRRDFRAATWAWTLAVCLNGIPTSLLKITVGRPRPDFFYRCFPDGVMVLNQTTTNTMGSSILDFNCTGHWSDINEGRKSFPSGHSSFAFASFGFVAYYVAAKLNAFNTRGRGQTWRLIICFVPIIIAALVAVSRTCDYHHHWQDVTVGAVIGLLVGYFSYRQYYPSIFSEEAGTPYFRFPRQKAIKTEIESNGGDGDSLKRPLLNKEQSKWY